MMTKEFDFDDIGKQTPYRTPEGFYGEMQRKVLEKTGIERRRKRRLVMMITSSVAMAAMLIGFLFSPMLHQKDTGTTKEANVMMITENNGTSVDPVDKWINELSDEELEELVSFSDNDIFLN